MYLTTISIRGVNDLISNNPILTKLRIKLNINNNAPKYNEILNPNPVNKKIVDNIDGVIINTGRNNAKYSI